MPTRVMVIGGGVVGLCCAREILRHGGDVTLVDRNRCGEATSWRNAGQVVPSLAAPLATPGAIRHALGWLLQPSSPFRLRPRPAWPYLAWLLRFARNTSKPTYDRCLRAAAEFGADTTTLFDDMRAEGVAFEMHHDGLLFAALSPITLDHDIQLYRDLETIGHPRDYEILDGRRIQAFEPALSADIAGGVFVPGECHVRPESLVQGLRDDIVARGGHLHDHTPIQALHAERGSWLARSSGQTFSADRVLVTAGAWTPQLLRPLGVRIPIEAGKGYSITARGLGVAPRRPLKFTEPELVVTPYDDAVRVSGLFDLGSTHARVERRRVNAITHAAEPYLRDWRADAAAIEWAGLRPATPDTLPIIDAVPGQKHLYVAAGHGILGVTHAPATARAVAPLVLEGRRMPTIEPLGLDRF